MCLLILAIVILSISAVFAAYLAEFFTTSFQIAKFAKATSMALGLAGIIMLFIATDWWWGLGGIVGYWLLLTLSRVFWHKRLEQYLKAGINPYPYISPLEASEERREELKRYAKRLGMEHGEEEGNMKGQKLDYQQMAFTAEALNNQGRHQEVIQLLLPEAEQPDNQNASFFNEIGFAYGAIGSRTKDLSYWVEAYKYHRKAYELDSTEPMYMFNLAMAASWLNKLDEALDLFKKYVATGHKRERKLALDAVKKLEALQ